MAFLDYMIICSSDIYRCQESTSSPAVSNSISEGIIEEEEDEEAAEESNKKRMKEDDQEVLFIPPFFIFQGLRITSWECWFLLCRCRRKVFSPGESSCRRQKSTGKAGSEASPLFFSPAQHLNFSYSQVSPLAQGNIRSTRTVRLFRWRHTSLNKYKWFKIEVQSYFTSDCTISHLTSSVVQEWTGSTKTLLLDRCKVRGTACNAMLWYQCLKWWMQICMMWLFIHREISDAGPSSVRSCCSRGRARKGTTVFTSTGTKKTKKEL